MNSNPILYIKITITKKCNNPKYLKIYISDKFHLNKVEVTIKLPYPLEIINGVSDELIIPVHNNKVINQAYIKRLVFKEETEKEEIIKEYLEIPNIFLFEGVNYIKIEGENMNNNELYFKDCFTEIDEGKVNADFNKATVNCFDSKNNKFSMDCEGNLVVNSIITRESNPSSGLTIDQIYPVGSFYFTSSNINPSAIFGGTWRQIKDKFLLSCGDKYSNGDIGGTDQHQHKLPIGLGNHVGNWDKMHWNHSFGYGTDVFTSPNYNDLNATPNGSAMTMYQLRSERVSNMPPYLAIYVWERIA